MGRACYSSCIYIPSHPVCKCQCVCMRMCLSVHSGCFICILSQAGRQAGFWQGPELWNGLSLQFCRWLDQPILLFLAEGSPNPIAAVLFCEILFHFTTLTDKKRAYTLVPAQDPMPHLFSWTEAEKNCVSGIQKCLNTHIVSPSCKYSHLHIYTFFHTHAFAQRTAEHTHTPKHTCMPLTQTHRHKPHNKSQTLADHTALSCGENKGYSYPSQWEVWTANSFSLAPLSLPSAFYYR